MQDLSKLPAHAFVIIQITFTYFFAIIYEHNLMLHVNVNPRAFVDFKPSEVISFFLLAF